MPDANGFLHLSDAPPRIEVECAACPRRGSYSRDRAIQAHGDVMLPDFIGIVSRDCPAHRHAINGNGCRARFAQSVRGRGWGGLASKRLPRYKPGRNGNDFCL